MKSFSYRDLSGIFLGEGMVVRCVRKEGASIPCSPDVGATEPDGLCDHCREQNGRRIFNDQEQPLAPLSKREAEVEGGTNGASRSSSGIRYK